MSATGGASTVMSSLASWGAGLTQRRRYRDLDAEGGGSSSRNTPVVPRRMHAAGYTFEEIPGREEPLPETIMSGLRSFLNVSLSSLPIVQWLPRYRLNTLVADLIAGVNVGILLIPQGMAYSVLAGLPPIYGLYSSTVPLIVYTLFASSTKVSVGPVAPTSILINSAIASLRPADTVQAVQIALALSFACGIIQIALGALRFGFIASLLSWPVMSGFLSAAGITIIASQLNDLFGITAPSDSRFYMRVYNTLAYIPTMSWQASLIGIGSLVILVGVKHLPKLGLWPWGKRVPNWFPTQLIVVALGIGISLACDFSRSGSVRVVGHIPAGLPSFSLPVTDGALLVSIFPQAFVLAVIAYIGTISLGVAFAKQAGEDINANVELFASGVSCLAGSFFQGFTSSGSFTRTAINASLGAKTPAANLFAAILVILALLFIAPVFEALPTVRCGFDGGFAGITSDCPSARCRRCWLPL